MVLRTRRARATRRVRGGHARTRFSRKRYGNRRPFRVRRAFYRRRKIGRRLQNDVKFSSISYEQSILRWIRPPDICEDKRCWYKWERRLPCGLFIEKNQQFFNNCFEYQWIKFNYIAVKITELNYYGYTDMQQDSQGKITQISGISALNFENMPFYVMWDLEQDMSWDTTNHIQVDPESFSQYALTKKMYPKKRGVTFLWRFPKPWRQFVSTYQWRGVDKSLTWGDAMEVLTGIKNYRAPRKMLGCHMNPFVDLIIPSDAAYGIKGRTQLAYKFYLGCSFRGRAVAGVQTVVPSAPKAEVEIEVLESDVRI